MSRRTKRSSRTANFKALALGLLLALVSAEGLIRSTHLDLRYLSEVIFYNQTDWEMYRSSESADLIYEPLPGAKHVYDRNLNPKETRYKTRTVTYNSLGFRSPEWPAEKPPGLFRILILGGSTTYGLTVSDADTYPAKLQALLDHEAPGKFQVWNGGITAGVLSQNVAYGRRAMGLLKPDLVIIQDFFNFGRRAFTNDQGLQRSFEKFEFPRYFARNPELYAENIPLLLTDNPLAQSAHYFLLRVSAIYRLAQILVNNHTVKFTDPNNYRCALSPEECSVLVRKYAAYAEKVSERELRSFVADYPEVPVLLFDPLKNLFCGSGPHENRGARVFSLCNRDKPAEYRDAHPPSYVYDYYARGIFAYLKHYRFLP